MDVLAQLDEPSPPLSAVRTRRRPEPPTCSRSSAPLSASWPRRSGRRVRSTGQGYHPSDSLVSEVHAFADSALVDLRDGDTFADATEAPRSATAIERLAACTGRTISAALR